MKPGGSLYLFEFHPAFQQLDENGERKYGYFESDQPDRELMTETYTDGEPHEPLEEYWWNHPVSGSITALLRAGMTLEAFQEYPYSPYKTVRQRMMEIAPGKWVYDRHRDQIPYVFSVISSKPG